MTPELCVIQDKGGVGIVFVKDLQSAIQPQTGGGWGKI